MGLVYAEIDLTNELDIALNMGGILPETDIRRVRRRALVDSGAYDLVINEEIKEQLGLLVLDRRRVRTADERVIEVDMVGPVEVRFENRTTTVRAAVVPNTSEVLLGAIPMEGLDVVIDPVRERLLVNPESPDAPMSYLKKCA
ncbi:MAG TPA: clan AA aspartic protease [Pyrinomonadaceae bacterium]|nr:clan AA aspartic protease [Pyrinomonadaceae bacterium]